MSKQIVHMETKVRSVFGLLDEEGNIVRKFEIEPSPQGDELSISVLNEQSFINSYFALYKLKEDMISRLKQEEELAERQKEQAASLKAEEEVDINFEG
jgi:hypothetical protein